MQKPLLISMMLNLQGKDSHFYHYHVAVGKAAQMIGWEHRAAIPITWNDVLPPGWSAALVRKTFQHERNPMLKIRNFVLLRNSIVDYIQTHASQSQPTIIFLDWVAPVLLLAVVAALRQLPNHHLTVWVMYRDMIYRKGFWNESFRFLTRILEKCVGGRLTLLTDSELLCASLSHYFSRPVHGMPVLPYVDQIDGHHCARVEIPAHCLEKTICWFPGPPTVRKGRETVRHITRLTSPEANQLCIVAAQSTAYVQQAGGCQVVLIENVLNREEYLRWFATSHIILLPYHAHDYAEKTSGIFTESILFGCVPIVTPNTWMAYELQKYHLNELIVSSWNTPTIVADILRIAHHSGVKQKIAVMQKSYVQHNGEHAFADMMQEIWKHAS